MPDLSENGLTAAEHASLVLHPSGRKLKIAFYLNDLSGGGVERLTLTLIRALHNAGAEVALLLHSDRGPLALDLPAGIPVTIFNTRRVLQDIGPIARYLRRARPDVLLAALNHNNLTACLAGLLAGGRTKIIISQHNALSQQAAARQSWKYRIIPFAYRCLAPLAAGIIAVSKGVATDLTAETGIPAARISVIYNPIVNAELLRNAAASVSHPWFGADGIPIFVSAGRLVDQKNHAMLLRAFALYRQTHAGRLMIFGEGPRRAEYQQMARDLGIETDTMFCGFVENPLPYYRHAKAFVLSSRFEGFGNVLIEAMSCGLPVISTDCPYGPSEILEDGKFGRLIPVDDVAAMATAMAEDMRAIYPEATLRARANLFSVDASMRGYLQTIQNVVRAQR